MMALRGHSLSSTPWPRGGGLRHVGRAVWGQARSMRRAAGELARRRLTAGGSEQQASGRKGKPAACSVQRAVARQASDVRHAACVGRAAWRRPAVGELARGQARSVRCTGGRGVACGAGEQRRLHPGVERLRSSSSSTGPPHRPSPPLMVAPSRQPGGSLRWRGGAPRQAP